MKKLILYVMILILPIIISTCKEEQKSQTDNFAEKMEDFENETEKEIMARKVDILQMKEDIKMIDEPMKTELMQNVNNVESDLLQAEAEFLKLRDMNKNNWIEFQPQVDSTIQYLGGRIDSIKLNITVITDTMQ